MKVSGEGNSKEDLKLAVGTLYRKPAMVEGGVVYKVREGSFCGEVADTRARHKKGPRCTPWYDEKDAGVVYLVRSANTSRFS